VAADKEVRGVTLEGEAQEGTYVVVVNEEEQYSIWPTDLTIPEGWRNAGMTGSKADCLAYVDRVWTDMRPRSLRERMDAATGTETPPAG
jgi:MbtH protein